MDQLIDINFKVTLSQKETINSRTAENGFDDIASYVKVVALKTQSFTIKKVEEPIGTLSEEISFKVSPEQMKKIEENMKASECDNLSTYLSFVAENAVVSAVIEVRSTGSLDDMLARIAKSRNLDI